MSVQERNELAALTSWLATFPAVEQEVAHLEAKGRKVDVLNDPNLSCVILEVALEICGQENDDDDGGETTMGHSGDIWDTILGMTQRRQLNRKKKSLDPPVQDTPHKWNGHVPHAALANLLDGAVSHHDLQFRKEYIERIMGLSAETQRSLMSLIERRKRQKAAAMRTPSKSGTKSRPTPSKSGGNPKSKLTTPGGTTINAEKHTLESARAASSPSLAASSPSDTPASRHKRASPGEDMMQSPFSPYAETIAQQSKSTATGKSEAPNLRKPRNLFLSPNDGSKNNSSHRRNQNKSNVLPPKSPRRSFDQAFGSFAAESPVRPSPKRVPIGTDQSFFSPGLGDTAEIEKQFQALKETNEELAKELAKKEAKEEELSQRLEQSAASFRNEMMKLEAEARRREEDTQAAYQGQLNSLKQELSKLQQQYMEASQAQAELAGVKDEMELMMHTKNQLAETQERLQTYREKVQQLNDVREALKREEEAHSKSVEECLRLETELKNVQPLKRQLEDYKTRAVEAEVRLAESLDELKKVKEQRWTSDDATSDLERAYQLQQEEIQELRMRLKHESCSERNTGSNGGVGDGLSELNPELKEEVFRLRSENQRLRAFADKREDDAVTKMEQELEDAIRLGDRYKTQYLGTRDQLETVQRNLNASRERESKLRNDVSEAMDKIKLTQGMVEDVSQQLYQCSEELKESRNRESDLEAELASWLDQAKALQDQTNEISLELRNRSSELEVSKSREHKLNQDVFRWKQENKENQLQLQATSKELKSAHASIQALKAQESDLRVQVDEWINTATSLEGRVKMLNDQLDAVDDKLRESRANEDRLSKEVGQATQYLKESNNKCEELVGQIAEFRKELDATRNKLAQCQERERTLEADLSDMTSRAEDAEAMSKQRMDLVQNAREKLKAANSEIEELKETESQLSSQVEEWTKIAETAQGRVTELEKLLANANELNDRNGKDIASQSDHIRDLTQELEGWKSKATAAEELTERLQEELMQTREVLGDTQLSLQSSKSNEQNMEEGFTHAEHMIFSLEESLEEEIDARRQVEDRLDEATNELARVKEELETTRCRLTAQLEEQTEVSTKFRQDLFHSQETLNGIQGSLGAAQHREKMLKLEIKKLQDRSAELERELEASQKMVEQAAVESSKTLDATCEILNSKAQKELDEMQSNMNRLLEDERRAKRKSDEAHQRQLKELRQDFEKQLAELQSTSKKNSDESFKTHEANIQQLRDEYEAKISELKTSAEEDIANLMTKGKGMLRDARAKAQQDLDAVREELSELQNQLLAEQQSKEQIIVQAKTKVAAYKKKLEFASSRINTLSTDTDELESKVRSLERERFKLSEENDRYRRQLGGRGGPDSKLQSQLDLLQKEFKSATEEARELRRKLKERDDVELSRMGSLDTIDENRDSSYSRDTMSQSTLVQLRTEYEEMIEALNDEKRELVMKNSAATTDVQKAERRAWESEQENASLKQEITSLKLQMERLEQAIMSTDDPPPPPPPPPHHVSTTSKGSRHSRKTQNTLDTEDTERTSHTEEDARTELNPGFTDVSSMTPSKSTSSDTMDSIPPETNGFCQAVYQRTKQPTGNVLGLSNKLVASPHAVNMGAKLIAGASPRDIEKARKALPTFVELHGATDDKAAPPECKQC